MSEESPVSPPAPAPTRFVRLTRVLAIVAAVLGFSALLVRYLRDGEIDFIAMGGGVLMLVIAFTAGKRR